MSQLQTTGASIPEDPATHSNNKISVIVILFIIQQDSEPETSNVVFRHIIIAYTRC